MKKPLLWILFLALCGLGSYYIFWGGGSNMITTLFTENSHQEGAKNIQAKTGSIADMLGQSGQRDILSGNNQITGNTIEISGNPDGMDYTGGGEYRLYTPQSAKDALLKDKKLVLYFHATRDPTDESLDKDLQQNEQYIPENTIIFNVDYDKEATLKKTFAIQQQNTLLFLDDNGKEKTRRAIGISKLSQILDVILER